MKKTSAFNRFANAASRATGRPLAFILAMATIVVWAVTGPFFGFSDTWQLVINTGTTIITFLMVFLIQNTQNRDTGALQIKLDELIRAVDGAHTALLDLEALEEGELDTIKKRYWEIARRSREAVKKGEKDTGTPFVHCEFEAGDSDGSEKRQCD